MEAEDTLRNIWKMKSTAEKAEEFTGCLVSLTKIDSKQMKAKQLL